MKKIDIICASFLIKHYYFYFLFSVHIFFFLPRLEEILKEQEQLLQWYAENKDKLSLKKTRKGRRGGGMRWPLWVVKVVCELLIISAMPSTIPKILVTLYEQLTGELPDEVPSLAFIRQTRLVVQYLGQFLIADKLGWRKTWDQVGMDATTRRHVKS